ncbi:MAG TPA: DUF456 domain-containing protein [Cryomorphaceae bacterium]|nr:DUF456 domain-containing protein [Cryomorphaceae bacterium]
MDIALAIIGGLFIFVGIVGSLLPVIPGPPLSWVGLLLMHFSEYASFSTRFLVISAVVMVVVTALDYFIPIWGTKKFGGSRAGVMGSTIGLIVGLFFGPIGIILGPFLGAFIGELAVNRKETRKAMRSATGSFVGFLLGTGLKLIYGGFAAWYYSRELFF